MTTQILGAKKLSKWHASIAKLVFLVQTKYKQCDFQTNNHNLTRQKEENLTLPSSKHSTYLHAGQG